MKIVRAGIRSLWVVPFLLIVSAGSAFAYEAGDIIVRGGLAYVVPDATATVDSALNQKNLVDVEGAASVTLTGTYMFHRNFGVEVVGAMPFQHDIDGAGALKGVGKVAETKHLPPSVMVQFYPVEKNTNVQPYAGVGLNYTTFFENDTTEAFTSTLNARAGTSFADTSIDLDDSSGLGVEIGVDWLLNENVSINTAIWYLDIETTATIEGEGVEITEFDVAIDPVVFAVGCAFRF